MKTNSFSFDVVSSFELNLKINININLNIFLETSRRIQEKENWIHTPCLQMLWCHVQNDLH